MADALCYNSELDSRTKKVFSTPQEYDQVVDSWQDQAPEHPGMLRLAAAYAVFRQERPSTTTMKDKQAHCFMGCRMSQRVHSTTAIYVGWLKEDRDIKDCHKGSQFEEEDYRATARGAQLGESLRDAKECRDACVAIY